jgi:hypothetical protein
MVSSKHFILFLPVFILIIGMLVYGFWPKSSIKKENILRIKLSEMKLVGLFCSLISGSCILFIGTYFISTELYKSTGVRLDFVLGLIAIIFLFAVNVTCIFIFLNYFVFEISRLVVIDLSSNTLIIKSKHGTFITSNISNLSVKRISSKSVSIRNPINLFEYIQLDQNVIITNLSIDIDDLIENVHFNHLTSVKKWIPIIKK